MKARRFHNLLIVSLIHVQKEILILILWKKNIFKKSLTGLKFQSFYSKIYLKITNVEHFYKM